MILGGITTVSVPKFACPCILMLTYVNNTTGYIRISRALLTLQIRALILCNSVQYAHIVHQWLSFVAPIITSELNSR